LKKGEIAGLGIREHFVPITPGSEGPAAPPGPGVIFHANFFGVARAASSQKPIAANV
jgi:hypothetical protein